MLGCTYGKLFQTAVAGGSYQEGLSIHIQGVPAGMFFTEEEIYCDLLLRKPGQGELTSPRREADVPVIFSGVNAADTMPGFANAGYSNGTPLVILIPNVDRHFEHIEQYQRSNRTPRPGHASYASFQKYGSWDDAIGAGFFSGRYTSTIVAAGVIAKRILASKGISVTAYVREAAGVGMPEMELSEIRKKARKYRDMRRLYDPIHQRLFANNKLHSGLHFFEKVRILAELEKEIPQITPASVREMELKQKFGVHPNIFCPHLETAEKMAREIMRINQEGDSSGGVIEVIVNGAPAGLGEPVFNKLDGELGRLMSIGSVKAVEVGCGTLAARMKGSECNDQMRMKDGQVSFQSNHAGGITGGLATGQDIVARFTIKPTPTIAREQKTIDKISLENKDLAAVTRRDPTIVTRVWPVIEGFTAMVILDQLMHFYAMDSFRIKA